MTALLLVALALLVVSLSAFYVSWRATRLDRLHARVETARAAFDAALLQRGAVVLEMATSGLLDPATGILFAEAETEARRLSVAHVLSPERAEAEQNLSEVLDAFAAEPDLHEAFTADPRTADRGEELLAALDEVTTRLAIAEAFYNETVQTTRQARGRPLARLFHLAGNAPEPVHFHSRAA